MTQVEIFQERIQAYREKNYGEPLSLVMNKEEFRLLKEECESFGTVELSAEEIQKAEQEWIYSDQVGTCFGVPVRVPEIEVNN